MTNDLFAPWWLVVDGVAIAHPDTRETRELIDAGKGRWFGSIEGCIKHGGVLATAYSRKTEMTYDAMAWLTRGVRVPAGYVTTTTITAQREAR